MSVSACAQRDSKAASTNNPAMAAELIQVSPHCYYIQSPAKIGLVHMGEGDEVCLIDSGNDKSAGKNIRKLLETRGWRLRAIYTTHSHADHIGGCAYLQNRTGCRVYAPGMECAFTCYPLLEPALLRGGYPGTALRGKFLMADGCKAEPLTPQALPPGWEIIPLPGHSFDMVGYRTPEDVVYLGDSLMSRATLEKYRIGYLCDVAAHLHTLDMLQGLRATCFIPAHAEATDSISELARYNAEQVHAVAELLLSLCQAHPRSEEELLKAIFDTYALTMTREQHALLGSALRSYLSWLEDAGRLTPTVEDNVMRWKIV